METVAPAAITDPASVPRPRHLLDQMRDCIRVKHYAPRAEHTYVDWIKRHIVYFGKQHPATLPAGHVERFPSHLASERDEAARALGRVPQGGHQAGSDYMHLMA